MDMEQKLLVLEQELAPQPSELVLELVLVLLASPSW